MEKNDRHVVVDITKLIEDWGGTDSSDLRPILLALAKQAESNENDLRVLKERYDLETNIGCAILEAAFKGPIVKKKE